MKAERKMSASQYLPAGWMDRWMEGWMEGQMEGWMDA